MFMLFRMYVIEGTDQMLFSIVSPERNQKQPIEMKRNKTR